MILTTAYLQILLYAILLEVRILYICDNMYLTKAYLLRLWFPFFTLPVYNA